MGMSIYQPVNWTTVAAMVVSWVAAQAWLVRRRRTPACAASTCSR